MNRKYFILIVLVQGVISLQAQTNTNKQIKTVFDNLVLSYGSAKSAPQLIIVSEKAIQKTPAFYTTTPKPSIKVDAQFYKLCKSFGKDSLNALSIVISHELAHYYADHTFCSDFAFAVSKDHKAYASKLKLVSKTERISLETQADYKGLFYAAIAGYAPFEVYSKLLDAIYKTYNLKEDNVGYPSKIERKAIAQSALQKTNSLYLTFQQGIKAKEDKKYEEAIVAFEEVNSFFPSRENYNNIGVVKTLKALDLKVLTSEEYHYPKRFLYPVEVDNTSRFTSANYRLRSVEESNQEKMVLLLKSAQKDFEKAISLDTHYTKAYINLACVFSLLNNPEAAIGKINELSKDEQESPEALRILAIAYYDTNEEKAKAIWKILKLQ